MVIAVIVMTVTGSNRDPLAVTREDLALPMLVISDMMVAAGLMACAVPARRALRVHPTTALKQSG